MPGFGNTKIKAIVLAQGLHRLAGDSDNQLNNQRRGWWELWASSCLGVRSKERGHLSGSLDADSHSPGHWPLTTLSTMVLGTVGTPLSEEWIWFSVVFWRRWLLNWNSVAGLVDTSVPPLTSKHHDEVVVEVTQEKCNFPSRMMVFVSNVSRKRKHWGSFLP